MNIKAREWRLYWGGGADFKLVFWWSGSRHSLYGNGVFVFWLFSTFGSFWYSLPGVRKMYFCFTSIHSVLLTPNIKKRYNGGFTAPCVTVGAKVIFNILSVNINNSLRMSHIKSTRNKGNKTIFIRDECDHLSHVWVAGGCGCALYFNSTQVQSLCFCLIYYCTELSQRQKEREYDKKIKK